MCGSKPGLLQIDPIVTPQLTGDPETSASEFSRKEASEIVHRSIGFHQKSLPKRPTIDLDCLARFWLLYNI